MGLSPLRFNHPPTSHGWIFPENRSCSGSFSGKILHLWAFHVTFCRYKLPIVILIYVPSYCTNIWYIIADFTHSVFVRIVQYAMSLCDAWAVHWITPQNHVFRHVGFWSNSGEYRRSTCLELSEVHWFKCSFLPNGFCWRLIQIMRQIIRDYYALSGCA